MQRGRVGIGAVVALLVLAPAAAAKPTPKPQVPRSVLVAYARAPTVQVFNAPRAATSRMTLPNPSSDGTMLSFLVRSVRPGWLRVFLPTRPNGSSGWIRRSQVRLYTDDYRLRIDLRLRRLTVWERSVVIERHPVAVGKAVSPTPAGTYYVVSRIQPTDPGSVYGSFAFGLSAHSNVYRSFGFGGDGRIGLHGTNDAAAIGHEVSHGCIRTTNRTILRLARFIPLGTPVEIVR
ncbi:MAG TPA: L,D-transpeptidase [Gaiellaceae bacterium]